MDELTKLKAEAYDLINKMELDKLRLTELVTKINELSQKSK